MIRTLLIAGILFACLFGTQGYAAETLEDRLDQCLQEHENNDTERLRCYDDIARQRQKNSTTAPAAAPPSAAAPQPERQASSPAAAVAAGNLATCGVECKGEKEKCDADRLRCYDDREKYSWPMCFLGSRSWIKESPGRLNACNYFFEDTERLYGYDELAGYTPSPVSALKGPYKPSYLSIKWQLNEKSRQLDDESRRERYVQLEKKSRQLEEEKSRLELEEKSGQLNKKSRQLERKLYEINEKIDKVNEEIRQLAEENRRALEEKSRQDRLALVYRQNYILFGTYDSHMEKQAWESANPGKELQDYELKYQISLKLKLFDITDNRVTGDWERHLGMHIDLWLAYTQLSFWQVYNASASRPFRETNYEPELILNGRMDKDLFDGWKLRFIQIGLNHQSNGQSQPLSRSWNRLMFNFGFERGNFDVVLKTWYRFPESAENDDNPDIESYLGYGEISAGYIFKNVVSERDIRLGLMFRNNLRFDDQNRSALQLGADFNLFGPFNLYVQYFTGYGKSLIDYNSYANSIGLGFSIKDW
ncbi:MAG TPA: phospholipase A [Syntrophales bacterium]|nr:phospholipase A [Syntrophales bacterium]